MYAPKPPSCRLPLSALLLLACCANSVRTLGLTVVLLVAVNRRMDEWVSLDNLNLNTVDIADIEGQDGKGCAI